MKRIWIPVILSLLLTAAAMLACSGQDLLPAPQSPTPTLLPYAVPLSYRNVSLVAPPFYTNKVTAENLDLREQRDPADEVPAYVQILIREGNGYYDVEDPQHTVYYSPASQILVYPLADLIQTYPQAADAAAGLQVMLGPGDAPLPKELPFWPLVTYSGVVGAPLETLGRPVLTAHRQYIDFGTGRGIRYITLLEQDPPRKARLSGLIYTFQGLTADRMYYVVVILSLGLPDNIPANGENIKVLNTLAAEPAPDYAAIAQALERVTSDKFFLPLEQCDALVSSLAVSP
jgi:hypothetical protein